MRKLALAIAALLACAFAVGGAVAPASAAPAVSLYTLVNQTRAANGLPALDRNPGIEAVAVAWANKMAAGAGMVHNPALTAQMPAGWTSIGENVAQGQPNVVAMHEAWLKSAEHRANILGDYTDIGVAFVTAGGTTWGVEDFGKYPATSSPPPTAAARAPAPTVAPTTRPALPQSTKPTAKPTPKPTASPKASATAFTEASAPSQSTPFATRSFQETDTPSPSPRSTKDAVSQIVPYPVLTVILCAIAATLVLVGLRRRRLAKHRE